MDDDEEMELAGLPPALIEGVALGRIERQKLRQVHHLRLMGINLVHRVQVPSI